MDAYKYKMSKNNPDTRGYWVYHAVPSLATSSGNITLSMFSDELKNQKQHWVNLKLHLLIRGERDVEHIVLLGLEKYTHKLRAIYIN